MGPLTCKSHVAYLCKPQSSGRKPLLNNAPINFSSWNLPMQWSFFLWLTYLVSLPAIWLHARLVEQVQLYVTPRRQRPSKSSVTTWQCASAPPTPPPSSCGPRWSCGPSVVSSCAAVSGALCYLQQRVCDGSNWQHLRLRSCIQPTYLFIGVVQRTSSHSSGTAVLIFCSFSGAALVVALMGLLLFEFQQ